MKKILMSLAVVASVFMYSGCDSDDGVEYLSPEGVQLLSELYPDIFAELQGSPGDSAYQIALDNGFEGDETTWLLSLVGATGETGLTGETGTDGLPGTDGVDGTDGLDGVCPDCDDNEDNETVIIDPVVCPNPFELDPDDTAIHMVIWHQRPDLSEYTFYDVKVIDGYPVGLTNNDPTNELPWLLAEDENLTFLHGIYEREDNITEDAAIGLQFSQTAQEVIID